MLDGGSLGIAKMSKFYSSNSEFELDIFTLETPKHGFDIVDFRKEIPVKTEVFSVFVNTTPTISGAFKGIISNKSYNLSRFKNKKIEQKLIEILSKKEYDFIQLENIFVALHLDVIRKFSKAKVILNSANIEYEIWKRLSSKASFFKRKYFKILANQLKTEEEEIWKKMDGIICATDKDKQTIKKFVSEDKLITVPFYLNTNEYTYTKNEKKDAISFFHLGAMDWLPNVEGVNWFINSIWNNINQDNKLYLAGKGMPKPLIAQQSKTISVQGFVDDAKEFMMAYDVMIVPLLSGSGIRVKIIEALALGKCIISTTVGAEGIEYTNNKNILIADTVDEFISCIETLINNPNKITEIGNSARQLAESRYDIQNMEKQLIPFFKKLK